MRHENRQPPTGVRQPLVELLGDDANTPCRRRRDVVEVTFVGTGVDDMALHVPRAVERGRREPRGRTAAEADSERDLALDPAPHAQPRERVFMRGEVFGTLALEVP